MRETPDMDSASLPDFERPPVVEIVAAVQFVPLPRFGMPEVVSVARAFSDWRILDAPVALPPIVEPPPRQPSQQTLNFGLGTPPVRVVLVSEDERWIVQLQQDRVAVHERAMPDRPSFSHVAPKLREVVDAAAGPLGAPLVDEHHRRAELVELSYENRLAPGEGWSGFGELHRVIRAASACTADPPHDVVEQMAVQVSQVLERDGAFAGRLRMIAEPVPGDDGGDAHLRLGLISRRYVHNEGVDAILDECHRDIVEAFTAMTTPEMHELWGRFR